MATQSRDRLSRDIRLSDFQIHRLDNLARKRIHELNSKIERALKARENGVRIQHNVLDDHYTEREELLYVREAFRVAIEQIARQIVNRIGAPFSDV